MTISESSHGKANTRRTRRREAINEETLTKAETLLCHEFDQAWDHYRHNENTRSQYLGYFFVLTVGTAAFGAQTIKSNTLNSPLSLVLFGVFLLTFAFLTGFVYLGVRKVGVVLTLYEFVWNDIRNYFYSSVDRHNESPYSSLGIRRSGHQALLSRWTRLQSSSEFIILFFSVVTVIAEALLTVRVFVIHQANLLERLIMVGMLAVTAAIPFFLVSGLGTSFRRIRNDPTRTSS